MADVVYGLLAVIAVLGVCLYFSESSRRAWREEALVLRRDLVEVGRLLDELEEAVDVVDAE